MAQKQAPDFAENGRAYAYYSAPVREGTPDGWNHTAVLSEFTLAEDGTHLDPESERVLLEVPQPQMNHKGGQLVFGHDGYLYLGLGDGGGEDDAGELYVLTTMQAGPQGDTGKVYRIVVGE